MNFESIGKNIRAYRVRKKLRQEDLAELSDLSVTYIGMVERGEKIPALETFIRILNALEVSADVILADVLKVGYKVKGSLITEQLSSLSPEDREKVYDVIATLIKHSKWEIKRFISSRSESFFIARLGLLNFDTFFVV